MTDLGHNKVEKINKALQLQTGSQTVNEIVTSVSGSSTDNQLPTAKAVNDTTRTTVLLFGNNSVLNTTVTRYLYPGTSDTLATTAILNMVIPFAGTIKNMHVYHNTTAGNGENIVYTLFKNGVSTALNVTIPSTTQTASDTSNTATVVAGDRLAVQVTKALAIGTSPSDIIVTMEIS